MFTGNLGKSLGEFIVQHMQLSNFQIISRYKVKKKANRIAILWKVKESNGSFWRVHSKDNFLNIITDKEVHLFLIAGN